MQDTELLDAIAGVYEAAADSNLLPSALQRVTTVMRADYMQLMEYDPIDERVAFSTASKGSPNGANLDYMSHFGAIDPRRPVLSQLPSGTLISCEEHFDDRFASRSEFYQDFLYKYGIQWTQGGRFDNSDGLSTCVALVRTRGRPNFDGHDMRVGRILLGHLERAELLRHKMTGFQAFASDINALVTGLPISCCLLDDRGRVLLFNAPFSRSVIGRHARLVHSRLLLDRAEDQMQFCTSLQAVVCMRVPASVDGVVPVQLVPLEVLQPSAKEPYRRMVMAFFETRAQPTSDVMGLVARFGLTKAEGDVLMGILDAQSAKQIALRRRTSLATARKQINDVLEKAMCRSQRELLSMVSRLRS